MNGFVSLGILLLAFLAIGLVFCVSGGIHILILYIAERIIDIQEITPKHRYYL